MATDQQLPPLPSFFCVGIEKCGTTTLHRMLNQHPDVYLGRNKEHFFFNQHFDEGIDWYRDRYSTWNGESLVGDITPSYFRNPHSYDRIHELCGPDSKGILVLRHPMIRAWSHYNHRLLRNVDDDSFEMALDSPLLRTDYSVIVRDFQERFGDRGLVIVYEQDMAIDPLIGAKKVGDHLGITIDNVESQWSNRGLAARHTIVARGAEFETADGTMIAQSDAVIFASRKEFAKAIPNPTPEQVSEAQRRIDNWTTSFPDVGVASMTERFFGNVIDEVEEQLGRSLDCWREIDEAPVYEPAPIESEPLIRDRVALMAPDGPIIDLRDKRPEPFYSRFGGNWIDSDRFADELERRKADGRLTSELADQIELFERDGYVILRGIVPEAILEQIDDQVEAAWEPGSGFIGRNNQDGLHWAHEFPADGSRRIVDPIVNAPSAQQAAFVPEILDFLTAVFDEDAMAFQSLFFERGSQQRMHQDTAYVVTSDPMRIIAAWIALEDVETGSGELMYYPKSHRFDEFLFGSEDKPSKSWSMERDGEERHLDFLSSLDEQAMRCGILQETFLPKRGDVLLWHADLAHGGTKHLNEDTSRRSIVVHYMPISAQPNYMKFTEHVRPYQVSDRAHMASRHYDPHLLDRDERPVFPVAELELDPIEVSGAQP